jgi:hypothetical protein
MLFRQKSVLKFIIPPSRFNNKGYLENRIRRARREHRGPLLSLLKFLYLDDGPLNVDPERFKLIAKHLEERELIVVKWLKTRTNGSLRNSYGRKLLFAARKSRYKCVECGMNDVRTLQAHHINGRVQNTDFNCLCSNCHQIKTRQNYLT